MSDNINLDNRKKRMHSLFNSDKCTYDENLIKVFKIGDQSINSIKNAVQYFIWDCLISSKPDMSIKIDDNFYKKYEEEIKILPNITPNGLLVPKKENLLSFNKLQKIIFQEFKKNKLNEKIDRVQFPVNVRIQSGSFGGNERARASTKKHTDIWAGDPSGAIIVFLHIFGDFKNIGIDFFETDEFPKHQVRALDDYDDGVKNIVNLKELKIKYNDMGWIFVDPFLLHQTYKNSDSIRISLDFRFMPKETVESDTYEDENRKPYFITVNEWAEYGDTKILSTKQTLFGEYKNNNFTKSYPVNVFTSDILDNSKNNTLTNKKFIGENYIKDKFDLSDQDFNEIFPDGVEILEYSILHGSDRDDVISSIINKINSSELRVSGENNNDIWEKGWGEILDSVSKDFHPNKLMPQYFDHHKIMRFEGNYIIGITENFVYKFDQIIRTVILKKYVSKTKKLIELGCGTGSGTILAAKLLNSDIKLIASDWASKSLPIIKKISEYTNREIEAVQFNMLDLSGWEELNVDKDSTIISFHALEQLGDNYKNLLYRLLEKKVTCIHLEPIYEYYNHDDLYDLLAKNYHKKRNYLGKYFSDIKKLESQGKAKITKELRIGFGDRFHEAYGLLIWKGI